MHKALALVLLFALSGYACGKPPPLTISELRNMSFAATLVPVRSMPDGNGYSAQVVSYQSGGLKVHALIATPKTARPDNGFPVLVANHGHHPEPQKYGITASGDDSRPGDYYRRVVEMFAAEGFLVVAPDYRGHNVSEGFQFTEGMLEASYYTEDVLNLISALPQIGDADTGNIFMWGHSMGGEVTLRALLVTDQVRAASMWSSVGGDIWDQSYYYSRYENPHGDDSSDTPKHVVERLRGRIDALDGDYDTRENEPLLHLQYLTTPIVIQHSVNDTGAAFEWSQRLAKELYMLGCPYQFYSYDSADHLFSGKILEKAAARDVAYFRSHMAAARP